jgi:hypothetical protein
MGFLQLLQGTGFVKLHDCAVAQGTWGVAAQTNHGK